MNGPQSALYDKIQKTDNYIDLIKVITTSKIDNFQKGFILGILTKCEIEESKDVVIRILEDEFSDCIRIDLFD